MTKNAALHEFITQFGLPAYPSASVPTSGEERPDFPYITYDIPVSSDMDSVYGTISLWYRTESWLGINAKTDEISRIIGTGIYVECDDGAMIIAKGNSFAQSMGDDNDNMIKRKILNITIDYITTY